MAFPGRAFSRLGLLLALVSTGLHAQEQAPRPARGDASFVSVDDNYFDLSSATGGDFYFWAPGEFAKTELRIPPDGEPIVAAYGELAEGERSIPFPVDGTAGRLIVFAGLQGTRSITLVDPSGTPIEAHGTSIDLQRHRHMLIAVIGSPTPGIWRLELSGRGKYSISARVKGRSGEPPEHRFIELDDFDFVEPGGRPGHEGYFPVERQPELGSESLCRVEVSGSLADAELWWLSPDGEPITAVALEPEAEPDSDELRLFGACRLPERPFRAALRGRDRLGHAFQRTLSALQSGPLADP